MALLYADEHFPAPVVDQSRRLGHDVLTIQEDGHAGLKWPDAQVLRRATEFGRAVLTLNRRDFIRLHSAQVVFVPKESHISEMLAVSREDDLTVRCVLEFIRSR